MSPGIDWGRVASDLAPIGCIADRALVRQKSRDFFWYSPVLNERLKHVRADLVVCPASEAEVVRTLPVTNRHRGAGEAVPSVPATGVRARVPRPPGTHFPPRKSLYIRILAASEVQCVPGQARVRARSDELPSTLAGVNGSQATPAILMRRHRQRRCPRTQRATALASATTGTIQSPLHRGMYTDKTTTAAVTDAAAGDLPRRAAAGRAAPALPRRGHPRQGADFVSERYYRSVPDTFILR